MTTRTLALALAALAALAAVAEAQQKKVRTDRNLITTEELAELQGHNGYEAVQKLRPDWLRRGERRITLNTRVNSSGGSMNRGTGRTQSSSMYVDTGAPLVQLTVFMDQTEMGGVEELQRLRNDDIREIRYLSGSD